MSNTFSSFEELYIHLYPKKVKKSPDAMLIQVTTWIDSHRPLRSGDVALSKKQANGKYRSTKVKKNIINNYTKTNADGSVTVTGLHAIRNIAVPLIQV